MLDHDLVERATRLPLHQRLELIETLTHSMRAELWPQEKRIDTKQAEATSNAAQLTENTGKERKVTTLDREVVVDRLLSSLNLDVPSNSSLRRVLGIAATNFPAPTDEELKDEYTNYLIGKYS